MSHRTAIGVALYLAAGLAFLIAVNADQQNFSVPFFVVAAIALAAGWITGGEDWHGLWIGVVLPWALVPLGLPFGDSNQNPGGDGVAPVALIAIAPALVSMALMPLAAGLRILYERHRGGHARRRAT